MTARILLVLSLTLSFLSSEAGAFETDIPRALAEAHFGHLHAFNMVAAYESRYRGTQAHFVVARRFSPERPALLMQLRSSNSLPLRWRGSLAETYAGLLIHNLERSDDLHVYLPDLRKVRRIAAPELEKQPVLRLLPLGDFRPIVRGELDYVFREEAPEQLGGALVVEGRPVAGTPSFDRVELHFARDAPLAVRTVFFADGQELRRVEIEPQDVREYGDRLLPKLSRIITPDGGVTELHLRNVIVDLDLAEEIFTEHNLKVQRFPHF